MLTREDLLVWSKTDFTPPDELRNAAPALALACLEARAFLANISNLEDEPEDVQLLAHLDAALAAAGVEVPDGE